MSVTMKHITPSVILLGGQLDTDNFPSHIRDVEITDSRAVDCCPGNLWPKIEGLMEETVRNRHVYARPLLKTFLLRSGNCQSARHWESNHLKQIGHAQVRKDRPK
jgi:hypothetical protein